MCKDLNQMNHFYTWFALYDYEYYKENSFIITTSNVSLCNANQREKWDPE